MNFLACPAMVADDDGETRVEESVACTRGVHWREGGWHGDRKEERRVTASDVFGDCFVSI